MAFVYENRKKELCVLLNEDNYIRIATDKKSKWIKVTNKNGSLHIEFIKKGILFKKK